MVSPDPPTDSFYQFPIRVSLILSIFIIAFVFIVKHGQFNIYTLMILLLAFVISYIIFPFFFPESFVANEDNPVDVVGGYFNLSDGDDRMGVIGRITLSLASLIIFMVTIMYYRECDHFVFFGRSWRRLEIIFLLKSALLVGVLCFISILGIFNTINYLQAHLVSTIPPSSNLQLYGSPFLLTNMKNIIGIPITMILIVHVPWITHKLSYSLYLRQYVSLLIRGNCSPDLGSRMKNS